ncbi:unnamed protein product [Schistocephalus solidus]|uniref:Uncharacterized protein n=1 Tax=Schistocephalus solidus TaxID=70667 RepID=A0A183T2F4_SCHSO|nr:unnamed protein product [Schistocephalus solidus]
MLNSDGTTLLTEKSQILKRWAEHFGNALNCSSAISNAAIDRLPQVDKNNELDLPPSLSETIRALQQLFSGKAPASDVIPPENTEAEMARKDPGYGSPEADWNPQNPHHAEVSATAMERPPGENG